MRRRANGGCVAIISYGASERHAGLRDVQSHQDIHSGLFGCGGLIHAAVGLSSGVGALLTKRAGFSWNA